jgi:hypothetical protein
MTDQRRRIQTDALGRAVSDLSRELRRIRKEEQTNCQARVALTARSLQRRVEAARQWRLDQMQRKQRARRELEEHQCRGVTSRAARC